MKNLNSNDDDVDDCLQTESAAVFAFDRQVVADAMANAAAFLSA